MSTILINKFNNKQLPVLHIINDTTLNDKELCSACLREKIFNNFTSFDDKINIGDIITTSLCNIKNDNHKYTNYLGNRFHSE